MTEPAPVPAKPKRTIRLVRGPADDGVGVFSITADEQATRLSRHDLGDRTSAFEVKPSSPGDFQSLRVQAEQAQDRRMNVRHIVTILHGVKAKFVRAAVDHAAFDPAPGQPRGKAVD